jgi:hypothetical protein
VNAKNTKIKHKIIVPADILPHPKPHEISAAGLIASYLQKDATFIKSTIGKTADNRVMNVEWEIKSPTGRGKKYNIQHQFHRAAKQFHRAAKQSHRAAKQSLNVVLDARRSKIHTTRIISEAKRQFHLAKSLKRLIIIKKDGKIIVFSK